MYAPNTRQQWIPLKVKFLFWLIVLLIGVYCIYWLMPYPRLALEIVHAGRVVFLWVIHR
jgi:hypothetical protein